MSMFDNKRSMCYVVCEHHKDGREYLTYYNYCTKEEAQKEINTLNNTKPEKLFNGLKINWETIEYFFISQQETMGD